MNFLFAIIDSIIEFVKRNPLTTVLLVMLAVFMPSFFGVLAVFIGVIILLVLALPIIGIFKLRRMSKKMEEQARQQGYSGQGFGGQGYGQQSQRGAHNTTEGDVKVYTTSQAPEKRVSDDVGDYVDFEEVKQK